MLNEIKSMKFDENSSTSSDSEWPKWDWKKDDFKFWANVKSKCNKKQWKQKMKDCMKMKENMTKEEWKAKKQEWKKGGKCWWKKGQFWKKKIESRVQDQIDKTIAQAVPQIALQVA